LAMDSLFSITNFLKFFLIRMVTSQISYMKHFNALEIGSIHL
jgi:hypothetical protein